jgi:hypothetical protein
LDHIDGGGNQHRRQIQTKLATWLRREGYPPGYQILCHECHQLKSYGKETPMPPANGKVGKHYSFQDDIAKLIKDEAHKRDAAQIKAFEDTWRWDQVAANVSFKAAPKATPPEATTLAFVG